MDCGWTQHLLVAASVNVFHNVAKDQLSLQLDNTTFEYNWMLWEVGVFAAKPCLVFNWNEWECNSCLSFSEKNEDGQ